MTLVVGGLGSAGVSVRERSRCSFIALVGEVGYSGQDVLCIPSRGGW